ncbi:calcium-binding protein [Microvirga soli]|uniref:calcium-binding protein n=1 Tax=Microvirga soli TaxID=1854496 RepID=UPI00191EE1CC|nr:calcium-binding protein [Microvirga soli]
MAATIIQLGSEQQVNIFTPQLQHQQSVTGLADGGWLITWVSDSPDSSIVDIFQQRYDRDGKALWNMERRVNVETAGGQFEPSVTALNDGGWVVTWTSMDQDGEYGGIYQQHFDKDGIARWEEDQPVNTETHHHQGESSITALSNGGWVVTWSSFGQDGSLDGIFLQAYDRDGNPVNSEQPVNTYVSNSQYEPSVTALAGGEWLVTWTSTDQDGSGYGIYQQRYNADGTPKAGEQKVNALVAGNQVQPSVTTLEDGGWIVTWASNDQDGSGYGIYQQRYNADGTSRGGERLVNTETTGHQSRPSVTALEDGGWVVTWQSEQDGSGTGIYQQRYDKDGNPLRGEQQINVYESDGQFDPSVAGLAGGGWITTWTSQGQDGSDTGVFQRHAKSVAAFGAGKEYGSGTSENDVFQVRNGGLTAGDSLEAGQGIDVLHMIEAGTLDLNAATVLTGIEIVRGSSGNDIILADGARLDAVIGFQGGSGNDALHLKAGTYDFTTKLVSGLEAITLLGTGSITFADKATALVANSRTQDGAVTVTSDSFTLAERQQLYNQGIRKVTDAGGVHILQQAQASLSTQAVTENAGAGTPVGTLSAIDPNPGDGLRFELVDNAGGRFALSGNQLIVADGSLLDYESGTSHRIVVRVVDEGGIATDAAFTIALGDVAVETINGTTRADSLTGGTGQDVLFGGLGKDTLTGNAGSDIFVFDAKPNTKTNRDKITDFNVKDDTIWLDNKVFTKLGKAGSESNPAQLKKDFFVKGSKAKDKNDYVIYDSKKGVLSYDADGSGTKYAAVEIATLSKKLGLTYKDFFVI